jgi:2-succinyl-5-enolpyruvyl-6-hydroxy-3-cyclohexene-1-carboxylate synthase
VGPDAIENLHVADALIGALMDLGLGRLVLCPGSRSAPLALAALRRESQGLKLYTAIDERSAAFFALGLARANGEPVAVITTSGTAVAELLPAAVEADRSALPLLLITADRPERLKNCGANQSVNQEAFLQPVCRALLQGPMAGLHRADPERLTTLADLAWRMCLGVPAGPVHLNLAFDEPLHADATTPLPEPPNFRSTNLDLEPPALDPSFVLDPNQPGVIVVGPWRRGSGAAFVGALRRLVERTAWPVLVDSASGLRGLPLPLIAGYDLLLEDPTQVPAPSQLLRLGALPASRRLQVWLQGLVGIPQLVITEQEPRRQDPLASGAAQDWGGLARWVEALPPGEPSARAQMLQKQWLEAEERLQRHLDQRLPLKGICTEPALARWCNRLLPPEWPVMLANSSAVRDWESYGSRLEAQRTVVSFRGASGIDGTLSLAAGLTAQWGQLALVCGDLALLHDSNGWLWRQQLGGRLLVLLIDNRGGGIFEQLPMPRENLDFERLFAMPQDLDPLALAVAHGVPGRNCNNLEDLPAALAWMQADEQANEPMLLLRFSTERAADAQLRRELRRSGWMVGMGDF